MKVETKEKFNIQASKKEIEIIKDSILAKVYALADLLLDYEAFKVATNTHFKMMEAITSEYDKPSNIWESCQADKKMKKWDYLDWTDELPTFDCYVLIRRRRYQIHSYFLSKITNHTLQMEHPPKEEGTTFKYVALQ